MSNVDNTDLNSVPEQVFYEKVLDADAYAKAQQYYAAAVTRWLADVVYEMADPARSDGFLRAFRMTLRGLAQEIDEGRLQVPAEFR